MPMKKYKPEQIVMLLRQIAGEIADGKSAPQAMSRRLAGVQFTCCVSEAELPAMFRVPL
jgi:hypothetical protein